MKAVIYVFSGTGNTRKIAELYKTEFESNEVETTVVSLTSDFSSIPDPNGFDLVGFAYPIHGFNAPQIMLDFVKQLPCAEVAGKKYFILKSSGEPLKINNVSSGKMVSLLKKKGYVLSNEYHYVMPYNMIFRHTDKTATRMWYTAKGLAVIEACEVLEGKEHHLKKVPFGAFISWLFRIEHPAMRVNGRMFKVDADKCVKCGMCVKNCPTSNIRMNENGKFEFGGNCLMCTRCSFNCPTDAFNIALLNGWRVNGKYNFESSEDSEKETHKWYCKKAYKRYFENAQKKISGNIKLYGV